MEADQNSIVVLVLGPASIAALIAALVWWLTHRGPHDNNRDST